MSKLKSLLAMGLVSALAANSEYYGGKNEYHPYTPEPDWKRKKCKSCYNFTMAYQQCSRNPNNKACELYCKRKK